MATAFEVIRALHILFAALWFGGGLMLGWILPRTKGFEAIEGHLSRFGIYGPYLGVTSLLAVVFGTITFFMGDYSSDLYGGGFHVLGLGMALGTIAMVLGFAGHMPTEMKIAKAAEEGPIPEALLQRNKLLHNLSGILLLITGASMLTFRWFA